jgi:hypothetical protein
MQAAGLASNRWSPGMDAISIEKFPAILTRTGDDVDRIVTRAISGERFASVRDRTAVSGAAS